MTNDSSEKKRPGDEDGVAPPASSEGAKGDTSRLAEAPTAKRDIKPGEVADSETGIKRKSETSRIRLEDVGVESTGEEDKTDTSEIPDADEPTAKVPKTIRLRRPASAPVSGNPASSRAEGKSATDHISLSEAPTVARETALKSTTSRIILDAFEEEAPEAAKPKTTPTPPVPQTIKLKRPSGAVTEEELVTDQDIGPAKKAETAKIDVPPEQAPPVPITQRKTIRIKRTERGVAPRTVAITRPSTAVSGQEAEYATGEDAPQEVGLAFSIVAVAAVLVAASLVYLMIAQAFGPDLILPIPSQLL